MTRVALPNRRNGGIISFVHGRFKYFATWSADLETGQVTEVFLQGGKSGTDIEAVARDSAVAVSLALQHGADLQTLQRAMTRLESGAAAGPMGAALDEITKALNEGAAVA